MKPFSLYKQILYLNYISCNAFLFRIFEAPALFFFFFIVKMIVYSFPYRTTESR
uniref:Uncharacterized protein n=1 Tax=Octopus bimaculoides TaxID=37653 RepID=A0A0L8GJ40_OCTBM